MTRELVQQLSLRLQLLSPDRLAQLQETAEARARAEAEAAEAERRARAAVPQQSPIELPIPTK
jgi:LPS-assembly lipoprotein